MGRSTELGSGASVALAELDTFWWVFALRGGFAVLFAALLGFVGNLFGTIFFDPIMLVVLAVLVGFYVLGNALLLGVATVFAAEHHDRIWRMLAAEAAFATAIGLYIALSLELSRQSLAVIAGLHALGTACFLALLAFRLRMHMAFGILLSLASLTAAYVGVLFLAHREMDARPLTHWLGAFEFVYGFAVVLLSRTLYRQHKQSRTDVHAVEALREKAL